jgi:hypothetical protein
MKVDHTKQKNTVKASDHGVRDHRQEATIKKGIVTVQSYG